MQTVVQVCGSSGRTSTKDVQGPGFWSVHRLQGVSEPPKLFTNLFVHVYVCTYMCVHMYTCLSLSKGEHAWFLWKEALAIRAVVPSDLWLLCGLLQDRARSGWFRDSLWSLKSKQSTDPQREITCLFHFHSLKSVQ
jgi:hypothetical protein